MLTQMIHDNRERLSDQPAIVYKDVRVTHAELAEGVERMANVLASVGIGPADPVAFLLPNSPPFIIGFFAMASLGAVTVPINPQFKSEELESVFRGCGVRAVITDRQGIGRCRRAVERFQDPPLLLSTTPDSPGALTVPSLIKDHHPAKPQSRPPEEDTIFLHSSGSTGRPKRVPRTQHQLRWEVEILTRAMGLTPADKIFCAIPLFHSYGFTHCMLAAAQSGATLVILDDPYPFLLQRQRAIELLVQEGATVFPGIPFIYRLLAEAPGQADLSCLRLCFSSGTALPRETFEAFSNRFRMPIRQHYGSTETGSISIHLDPDPTPTADSVGKAIEQVQVKIVDEVGAPMAPGQVGEVAIHSPGMTRGYAGMGELNRQVFRNGDYFTGDLGRLDSEGRLYLLGRKHAFIEVAGNKVDPAEVEDVLAAHPKVGEVVVVGVKGQAEGEQLVKAVVVVRAPCRERELIEFVQKKLASFKVPQIVEFREEIPRSPAGKILRKYLMD